MILLPISQCGLLMWESGWQNKVKPGHDISTAFKSSGNSCVFNSQSISGRRLPYLNHSSPGDFVDSTPTARKLNFVVLCILLSSISDSRKKRSSKTFTLPASRIDPSKKEVSDRDQQLLRSFNIVTTLGLWVSNIGTGCGRSVLEMGAAFEKASGKASTETLVKQHHLWNILKGKALIVGTSDKVQKVDQNYQVSQQVNSAVAKSAVFSNEYVSIGALWVTVTCNSIAKAAAEVSQHAKEKVALAEEEQRR
nr:PREDICTED: uncharacterized protein LOC108226379 [Daucus carota subsp. sativus]